MSVRPPDGCWCTRSSPSAPAVCWVGCWPPGASVVTPETGPGVPAPGRYTPAVPTRRTARLVVLVSGTGTNLQALLDACADPAYGATVVAVGADRDDIEGLERADRAGVPTFVRKVGQFSSREHWDRALTDTVAAFEPDLVVLAGFMKLVGAEFLGRFAGRVVNTHPALCPAFPGTSGPADALAYGVKVTGATLFVVD